jgi:X-Pro dipeptidyl-peptidase (S15 family)
MRVLEGVLLLCGVSLLSSGGKLAEAKGFGAPKTSTVFDPTALVKRAIVESPKKHGGVGGYPNVTSHTVVTRDGVKLYTQLWLMEPWESNPKPRATVLLRSPYPRIEQDVALPWLEQGYAVILQDMRGMEYSGGQFSFFRHGGNDSYDTMEWIQRQHFSNGVVFGYGISADGMVRDAGVVVWFVVFLGFFWGGGPQPLLRFSRRFCCAQQSL